MSSNTLPKLTEFRNRAIRIFAPFIEAQSIKSADMRDLHTEFESAFSETFDRETRAVQWRGMMLNVKRHFTDKEKLAKAQDAATCAEQYELFSG